MLFVTGTKRSGTSMWMQILIAAGFDHLGQAFPGKWGESIRNANEGGFYESLLRQGVYYATNPDPRSGRFVKPGAAKGKVVKVFIPGVIRSDYSYIEKVLSTMRHWREYNASLKALWELEDEWKASKLDDGDLGERESIGERRARAGAVPPVLEWWFENYELLRDVSVRGYPFHMLTYDRLLRDPAGEIGPVLEWLGSGDVEAAVGAVQTKLRHQNRPECDDPRVDNEMARVFDDLYAAVDQEQQIPQALVGDMNKLHERLVTEWDKERLARMDRRKKHS